MKILVSGAKEPFFLAFEIFSSLSPAECAQYIALSETLGYTNAPINTPGGFEMHPDIRNNQRLILDDPQRAQHLWLRLFNYLLPQLGQRRAIGLNERFRFYRYEPGQRFAIHHDGSYQRPNGQESFFTFMIYLNQGFDGGETRFYLPRSYLNTSELSVVPKIGMALCFVHHLAHEGAAVLKGRKYVLRSDVMYTPLLEG